MVYNVFDYEYYDQCDGAIFDGQPHIGYCSAGGRGGGPYLQSYQI